MAFRRLNLYFFAILIFSFSRAFAYEVDSWAHRYDPIEDSLPFLDNAVQKVLEQSINKYNKSWIRRAGDVFGPKCDPDRIVKVFKGNLVNSTADRGVFENMTNGSTLPENYKHRPNPINVWNFSKEADSRSSAGGPAQKIFGLGVTIQVNGVYMGDDKLGHFFDQGFEIHQKYLESTKKGATHQGALVEGLKEQLQNEAGIYGGDTTLVISYADISSSYGGYLFWKNLRKIGTPDSPGDGYVVCDPNTGQISLNKSNPFSWKNYVDSSWDEGINCNSFLLPKAHYLKYNNLVTYWKYLKKKDPAHSYTCPLDDPKKSICSQLENKYRSKEGFTIVPFVLGPGCDSQMKVWEDKACQLDSLLGNELGACPSKKNNLEASKNVR